MDHGQLRSKKRKPRRTSENTSMKEEANEAIAIVLGYLAATIVSSGRQTLSQEKRKVL